ncbi:unnamed protein product [Symbiodinium natans]|uniref:Bulb-type lectin domain-containing protein n=1 Tax=Symbiodinium natans TaxID=878477 RepID=A0A812SNH8_9DINO|nr:unnamed protein product [Symbiodinium natans]
MARGAAGMFGALVVLTMAAAAPDYPGKYVIKNAANGRRLGNSGLGFFATAYGPITEEHMWRIHAEGNNSFSLSNVASGSRILAQTGFDGAQGFFTVADGPVYQDQKWHLMMQSDGAFVIANAKSGRKIWAADEGRSGSFGASALASEGQSWWLIRQDIDESRWLRAELAAERQSTAMLVAKVEERDAKLENFQQRTEAGCPLGAAPWRPPDLGHLGAWDWSSADRTLSLYLLTGLLLLGLLNIHLNLQLQKERGAGRREEVASDAVSPTPAFCDAGPGLGHDFGYHILDTDVNGTAFRFIKIQCPGVEHEDVSVDLLFNGCQVRLSRRAACGVAAAAWAKRFEFPHEEGIFEFREDQMCLEHGFLHLAFRTHPFQSRRVRFPRHFTLTATDTDDWWDYPGKRQAPPCAPAAPELGKPGKICPDGKASGEVASSTLLQRAQDPLAAMIAGGEKVLRG